MEVWDLNLRHLQAIVKIADLGSICAAAQAVNLSQPAITAALARTEAMLCAQLYDRRHDGVVPTEAALLLVPRLRAALNHIVSPLVTTSRLRALLALADCGSYSAASARTGLSMPSLQRAVSDLSLSLRKTLVERRGRGVGLSPAGLQMVRAFRLAVVELEAGLAELAALQGRETRRIVVGAMPLSRARVLPAAVTRFLRRYPGVKISILEGSRAELIEPLRNGAIDMIIGALRDPLVEPDVVQQPLFDDLPAIIARKGHPLEGSEPGLIDLAAYPWVTAAGGAPLRQSWERMFALAGLPLPQVPIESGSVMTIRQLLIDSDLLTLLSPDQVAVELEAEWLTILRPAPGELKRMIGISTRDCWRPTAVQAEFVAELKASAC